MRLLGSLEKENALAQTSRLFFVWRDAKLLVVVEGLWIVNVDLWIERY
jgi:hypothetical protein